MKAVKVLLALLAGVLSLSSIRVQAETPNRGVGTYLFAIGQEEKQLQFAWRPIDLQKGTIADDELWKEMKKLGGSVGLSMVPGNVERGTFGGIFEFDQNGTLSIFFRNHVDFLAPEDTSLQHTGEVIFDKLGLQVRLEKLMVAKDFTASMAWDGYAGIGMVEFPLGRNPEGFHNICISMARITVKDDGRLAGYGGFVEQRGPYAQVDFGSTLSGGIPADLQPLARIVFARRLGLQESHVAIRSYAGYAQPYLKQKGLARPKPALDDHEYSDDYWKNSVARHTRLKYETRSQFVDLATQSKDRTLFFATDSQMERPTERDRWYLGDSAEDVSQQALKAGKGEKSPHLLYGGYMRLTDQGSVLVYGFSNPRRFFRGLSFEAYRPRTLVSNASIASNLSANVVGSLGRVKVKAWPENRRINEIFRGSELVSFEEQRNQKVASDVVLGWSQETQRGLFSLIESADEWAHRNARGSVEPRFNDRYGSPAQAAADGAVRDVFALARDSDFSFPELCGRIAVGEIGSEMMLDAFSTLAERSGLSAVPSPGKVRESLFDYLRAAGAKVIESRNLADVRAFGARDPEGERAASRQPAGVESKIDREEQSNAQEGLSEAQILERQRFEQIRARVRETARRVRP